MKNVLFINVFGSLLFLANINIHAQVNLTQGLVAYFPFSGNTNDVSGNNNNATNNGAVLTADQWGNPNSAYLFNGTSNYMSVASNATLQMSSVTLVAKVKPNAFYPGLCYNNSIFDRGNGGYNAGSFSLVYTPSLNQNPANYCVTPDSIHENYRINVNNSANPSLNCITPANAIPYVVTNQWDCVIGVFDNNSGTGSIYVNGIFRYSYSYPAGMGGQNNNTLFIGGTTNAAYPYYVNGVLDELRIYNRALNIQEIDSVCNYQANPPAPTDDIVADFTLSYPANCDPKTVQFTDQTVATNSTTTGWQWDFGDGGTSNQQNPLHTYALSGNYIVRLIATSSTNKKDTVDFPLIVGANPEFATATGDTIACGETNVHLSCTGGVSYSWTPCSANCNNSDYYTAINYTTQFIVQATDINGCIDIDTVYAFLTSNEDGVIVPNAFSPNGDGLNECAKVIHTMKFTDFYFTIYDRWGEQVFETDNSEMCWDGWYKGAKAELGTYFYYLQGESSCGKILKKGDITLVR